MKLNQLTFLLLFTPFLGNGQLNLATDDASNYGGSFSNGDNPGSGFDAWSIGNNYSGTFIGNPADDGMGTAGIGTTAFGFWAIGAAPNYLNATRPFTSAMQIGDRLSFYWAMNWDANGGGKGFDLKRSDGTNIINVHNSGNAEITINGSTADSGYGTTPMFFTATRTSSGYDITMTSRSGGATYTATVASTDAIDRINIYIGAQSSSDGERNIYFNHFSIDHVVVASDETYADLTIAEGRSLTVDVGSTLDVTGVLQIDGTLVNNGTVRLNSDANGTASVGEITGTTSGSGTYVFERYVPDNTNDATSFVNLSSYVSGINVSNWTGAGANYVFEYNETNPGGLNDGWGTTTGELEVGKGYMAQFAGTEGDGFTLSYSGALTSGNQDVALTLTDSQTTSDNDGWNLVGNPYPCPVTYSNISWTATNGTDAAPSAWYVWDGDNGGYTTKTTSDVIGVGQSFWVKANGAGTLTFEEADKTTGADPFVRSALDPVYYALRATDPSGKWSRGIRSLNLNATAGFDPAYDAPTFGNPLEAGRVTVWFEVPTGETLSLLATHPSDGAPVQVHVMTLLDGDYVFELDDDYGAPEGLCLTLTDTYTGEVYDLTSGEDVVVTLEAETVYHDRFLLGTAALPTPVVTSTWCAQGVVDYGVDAATWNVVWQDASTGATLENVAADGVVPGTYNLTWSQEGLCAGSTEVVVNTPCMGDFDGNGTRGSGDLLQLVAFLNLQDGAATLTHDCDCDGALGVQDILTFLSAFGTTCETE